MSTAIETLKGHAHQLGLSALAQQADVLVEQAEKGQPGYCNFAASLLDCEVTYRQDKQLAKRAKVARLPLSHDLDNYDYGFNNGMSPSHLAQLRELNWLDQTYNMILTGPSGTSKTYIAAGLCYQALQNGYKAYFRTMEQLMDCLRMKESVRSAMTEYKRLTSANLIVIDDIMLLPLPKPEATKLFAFINHVFETTSFIITTNKSPSEWAQMLDDEVLATAILDRLLYRCQLIPLDGDSYRMQNRKTIFKN
jgi:DNA replication protein DnaC